MTDEKTHSEPVKVKGVRIRILNAVMICLVAFVALVFLHTAQETNDVYSQTEEATNTYITCESASNSMKEASNYLTTQVRSFAATQSLAYMNRYFEEAMVDQRREEAIATLQENMQENERARAALQKSLEHSQDLMNLEYYSMKLVLEAKGMKPGPQASVLNDVVLSSEDEALSPAEKIERATELVYNEAYTNEVATIEDYVAECKHEILAEFQEIQEKNSAQLHTLLFRQQVLTWLMFAVVIGLILSFIMVILWPIQHYITRIAANEPLPMAGAYELRYLAHEYNAMYEASLRTRSQLQREAEHDHLTGLYNRGVFEKMLYAYREEPTALLLIDADYFKEVNDTLGHDGGDAMLQKIANQLTKTFRSSDYACRIGGDEFAVIMTDVTPELQDVVMARVNAVTEGMRDTSDGLPVMTLSVGVAFNEQELDAESLFKRADNALYAVKEAGRNGCRIYEKGMEKQSSPR